MDWVYDELVLAADLVRENGWTAVRQESPKAVELSTLLQRGSLHGLGGMPSNMRTPASVQRKTYDLVTADATYLGKPTRGGRLTAIVIREFRSDPSRMQAKVAAIRAALDAGEVGPTTRQRLEESDLGQEGGILEYRALRRERDRKLRDRKIETTLAAGGVIACEACGFNFGTVYGERGVGYIEIHHIVPLHITGPVRTRLDDLALVCANCHRMCHRGDWITPSAVAALMVLQNPGPSSSLNPPDSNR